MNTNTFVPLLIASAVQLIGPCHAIVISLDPLSTDTNVYGTWHQRREGASDATSFLPGFVMEFGVGREGAMPWVEEGEPGRWNVVVCLFSVIGGPLEAHSGWMINQADDLADDSQSRTTQGLNGLLYTYSFGGTYFPDSDEWDGTFSAVVFQPPPENWAVPEGGGSLVLLCGAMAGIHALRRRWACDAARCSGGRKTP